MVWDICTISTKMEENMKTELIVIILSALYAARELNWNPRRDSADEADWNRSMLLIKDAIDMLEEYLQK